MKKNYNSKYEEKNNNFLIKIISVISFYERFNNKFHFQQSNVINMICDKLINIMCYI